MRAAVTATTEATQQCAAGIGWWAWRRRGGGAGRRGEETCARRVAEKCMVVSKQMSRVCERSIKCRHTEARVRDSRLEVVL